MTTTTTAKASKPVQTHNELEDDRKTTRTKEKDCAILCLRLEPMKFHKTPCGVNGMTQFVLLQLHLVLTPTTTITFILFISTTSSADNDEVTSTTSSSGSVLDDPTTTITG